MSNPDLCEDTRTVIPIDLERLSEAAVPPVVDGAVGAIRPRRLRGRGALRTVLLDGWP